MTWGGTDRHAKLRHAKLRQAELRQAELRQAELRHSRERGNPALPARSALRDEALHAFVVEHADHGVAIEGDDEAGGQGEHLDNVRPVERELVELERGDLLRLGEEVPKEIQPLVRRINQLLQFMEMRLQRSRKALGNLAHPHVLARLHGEQHSRRSLPQPCCRSVDVQAPGESDFQFM